MANVMSHSSNESLVNGRPDPFGRNGWQDCSPQSLRGHIANAHFQARTLADIGVPLFDIEIAEMRGFDLGWVVKRAFQKLTREDGDIRAEIDEHQVGDDLDVSEYRLRIVKSMRTIADKRLAHVPWSTINDAYPHASQVPLDLAVDTTDASFKETVWKYRKSTYGGEREDTPELSLKYASIIEPTGRLMLAETPNRFVQLAELGPIQLAP